jgi:hypothetical protein
MKKTVIKDTMKEAYAPPQIKIRQIVSDNRITAPLPTIPTGESMTQKNSRKTE